MAQDVPFQRMLSACEAPNKVPVYPTAHTSSVEAAATARRVLGCDATLGLVTTRHSRPQGGVIWAPEGPEGRESAVIPVLALMKCMSGLGAPALEASAGRMSAPSTHATESVTTRNPVYEVPHRFFDCPIINIPLSFLIIYIH